MSLGLILLHMAIGLAIIMVLIMKCNINAVPALFIGSIYVGIACKLGFSATVSQFTSTFGGTLGSLGMSVTLGVIMGQLLADSGGASVIANTMVGWFPEQRAILALIFTSFFISIPVFFDVCLVIMAPIGLAVGKKLNAPRAMISTAITAGAGCAHTYVPPTPGPLAAAETLNFSMGTMMIIGTVVSIIAIAITYPVMKAMFWPHGTSGKYFTEKDMDPDFKPMVAPDYEGRKLPSFGLAVLPVIVPVILILIQSFWATSEGGAPDFVNFIGGKNIAMLIGCLIAYGIAFSNMNQKEIKAAVNKGLNACGMILTVTAAGGAFGGVIRATGITKILTEKLATSNNAVFTLAFVAYLIGFVLRVCMGSGSSSSISALAIIAPIVATIPQVHPVWFAMCAMCGTTAMGLPNDSGFWIVTNMFGFNIVGGIKTYSVIGCIRSVAIFLVSLVGIMVLPMGA